MEDTLLGIFWQQVKENRHPQNRVRQRSLKPKPTVCRIYIRWLATLDALIVFTLDVLIVLPMPKG